MLQVFGVDEQDAVCVSRLGGADQRERLTSQRTTTGDRGKPGRMETEVQKLKVQTKSCLESKLTVKNKQYKMFHLSLQI